ncbi:MAG: MerC domain-containing protein [Pseudomonadota bacterium]
MSSATTIRTRHADWYAATLSGLCLLHCFALPVFVSLIPALGLLSENELIHRALVLLTIPATLWVARRSLSSPGTRAFIIPAFVGLAVLIIAAFVEPLSAYEKPLTFVGSMLVACAHLWRFFKANKSVPTSKL